MLACSCSGYPTGASARSSFATMSAAQAARDAMLAEAAEGAAAAGRGGDASHKRLIARGCDPVMAKHSLKMLPPLLGNVHFAAVTEDDDFFALLAKEKWDVVLFAPGACRWDRAGRPIPGGTAATHGWTLAQYRARVRELQGEAVAIVETTEEREMVGLARRALGLPPA